MCLLSNLKRYLSPLSPSNQCPPASRLDELSLAQINSHRYGAEIGRRQPVDRLPLGACDPSRTGRVAMAAFGESCHRSGPVFLSLINRAARLSAETD
jgi:hypothetical protein